MGNCLVIRHSFWIAVLSIAGTAHLASAQVAETFQGVVVEVQDEGTPKPGADVFVVLEGTTKFVGTTSFQGHVIADEAEFDDDEPVAVWLSRSEDDVIRIVLTPAHDEDPCMQMEEAARSRCDKIGEIQWGPDLKIDIGKRAVTTRPRHLPSPLARIGFKVDAASFHQLEEVCGRVENASCSADGAIALPGILAELSLGPLPIQAGVSVFYGRPSVRLDFDTQSDPRLPVSSEGDIDVWLFDLYGKLDWRLSPRLALFGILGGSWIKNKGDFLLTLSNGTQIADKPDETTRAFRLGVGIEGRVSHRFGVRLNYDFRTGGQKDADALHAGGGGITVIVP